jgi:hypothetical protein
MTPGSTLVDQLANLGIVVPSLPEGGAKGGSGDDPGGGWIRRGQFCADGLQLLRLQLRNAVAAAPNGGDLVLRTVREAGRQSPWHQAMIHYLLAELQDESPQRRVQAAARLVAAEERTPAQLLGAALDLAGRGLVASAIHAIKRLVAQQEVTPAQTLELCALLVESLPLLSAQSAASPASSHEPPTHQHWQQAVQLQIKATRLLAVAASTAAGEASRELVLSQLEDAETLANGFHSAGTDSERQAIECVMVREGRKHTASQSKPVLRTIHHLACSGGTVISKCLAAMPDVALISEVNPFNRFGDNFQPTNPLLLLEKSYRPLSADEIIEEFLHQIQHAYQICQHDDVDLIIRDHSHTDFCMGTTPSVACPIANYLSSAYELLSAVTVRHPLDSYLGMLAQGWEKQFSPSGLDEYSRRYLAFLDRYTSLPILRYEDFCAQPEAFMKNLCNILDISYSGGFLGCFGDVTLTGDSGRKGVSTIEPRPRREVPEQVQSEIETSKLYLDLVSRLGY